MGAAKPSQCNEPSKITLKTTTKLTCHHCQSASSTKFPQGRLLQGWLHGQLSRSPTSTHEDLYCRSTKSGHRCGHCIMAQLAQRGILPNRDHRCGISDCKTQVSFNALLNNQGKPWKNATWWSWIWRGNDLKTLLSQNFPRNSNGLRRFCLNYSCQALVSFIQNQLNTWIPPSLSIYEQIPHPVL